MRPDSRLLLINSSKQGYVFPFMKNEHVGVG